MSCFSPNKSGTSGEDFEDQLAHLPVLTASCPNFWMTLMLVQNFSRERLPTLIPSLPWFIDNERD